MDNRSTGHNQAVIPLFNNPIEPSANSQILVPKMPNKVQSTQPLKPSRSNRSSQMPEDAQESNKIKASTESIPTEPKVPEPKTNNQQLTGSPKVSGR
jgi:hypothetical protein